jgi:hypothetical protein
MQAAVLQISLQNLQTQILKNVTRNVQPVRVNVAVKDPVQMASGSVVSCQVNQWATPIALGVHLDDKFKCGPVGHFVICLRLGLNSCDTADKLLV